jgi:DNA-binding MarR family transcriptional regulator
MSKKSTFFTINQEVVDTLREHKDGVRVKNLDTMLFFLNTSVFITYDTTMKLENDKILFKLDYQNIMKKSHFKYNIKTIRKHIREFEAKDYLKRHYESGNRQVVYIELLTKSLKLFSIDLVHFLSNKIDNFKAKMKKIADELLQKKQEKDNAIINLVNSMSGEIKEKGSVAVNAILDQVNKAKSTIEKAKDTVVNWNNAKHQFVQKIRTEYKGKPFLKISDMGSANIGLIQYEDGTVNQTAITNPNYFFFINSDTGLISLNGAKDTIVNKDIADKIYQWLYENQEFLGKTDIKFDDLVGLNTTVGVNYNDKKDWQGTKEFSDESFTILSYDEDKNILTFSNKSYKFAISPKSDEMIDTILNDDLKLLDKNLTPITETTLNIEQIVSKVASSGTTDVLTKEELRIFENNL